MKLGVGRKITYSMDKEEKVLLYAMITRESDEQLTLKNLKEKALEIIADSDTRSNPFKGSDGWAKKFCVRNELDFSDKFSVPKKIPK